MSFYSPELNERKTRAKKNKPKIDQHVANKVYNLRPSSVISENNERGKKEDSGGSCGRRHPDEGRSHTLHEICVHGSVQGHKGISLEGEPVQHQQRTIMKVGP